jgi:hypothetical protein
MVWAFRVEAGHGPGCRGSRGAEARKNGLVRCSISWGQRRKFQVEKSRFASTHSSGSIVGGSNGAKFAFDWVNDMEFAKSRDKQAKAKAKEELEAA